MYKKHVTSLIGLMILACSSTSFGQGTSLNQTSPAISTPKCPTVVLTCPTDSIPSGMPLEITARVIGSPDTPLTYNWSVSVGTIVGGQNSPTVVIDTTSTSFQCLAVTLEVKGVPDGCPKVESCTRFVHGIADPVKFDEYGYLSFEDEKARLDNAAYQLKIDTDSLLRLVGSDGRNKRKGTALKRIKRAKDYLIKTHGIDENRIALGSKYPEMDAAFPQERFTVELWIEPLTELVPKCN